MTTAVARARPQELLRAACLLGGSADEMGTAVAACRSSASVDWVGRPNENYQERLSHLARGLVGMQSAFEDACDALLAYARALGAVQPLAEEADRLVLDDSEALIQRAALLRAEAREAEAVAAMRLVIVLDDLTSRAPKVSAFALQVGLTHVARGFVAGVESVGDTVSSIWHSLPGVGSDSSRSKARDDLEQTALDTLQPWKAVQELWDAINDGHAAFTAGDLAAGLLFHFRGARSGRMVETFGNHDLLPASVMLLMTRGVVDPDLAVDGWALERIRKDFVAALVAFEHLPLPSLDELLQDGVDLLHHEAAGGHTLLKHIGRDPDFLRFRQGRELGREGVTLPFSSFSSLGAAETGITRVLRDNEDAVRAWLDANDGRLLELRGEASERVGTLLDADGELAPVGTLVVRLVHDEGGRVLVSTAFLDR